MTIKKYGVLVMFVLAVLFCSTVRAENKNFAIECFSTDGMEDNYGYVSVYNASQETFKLNSIVGVTDKSDLKTLSSVDINEVTIVPGRNKWKVKIPDLSYNKQYVTKHFLWDENLVPYTKSAVLTTNENIIYQKSVSIEAEHMTRGSQYEVTEEAEASNGTSIKFTSYNWEAGPSTEYTLSADIYLPETEEEGRYNLWMRVKGLTNSSSLWQDLNTGEYVANWISSEYSWDKSTVYLKHGKNTVKFSTRTPMLMDRVIITGDVAFSPVNVSDYPENQTDADIERALRSYWSKPDIKPISGHPRLLMTPEYIQFYKENVLGTSSVSRYRNALVNASTANIDGKLDISKSENYDENLLAQIMVRALFYVTGENNDTDYAKATVQYMKNYLSTFRSRDDTGDITRVRGNVMLAAAFVYDWCYDVLTDNDKKEFIEAILNLAQLKEVGWPPTLLSSISSHAGEYDIFRDFISAGIAIYDEYPLLYDVAAGRLFDEMVPARNWLRQAGRFDQGNDYGEARYYSEVFCDAVFKRMGYNSIFNFTNDSSNGNVLHSLLYMRRPDGIMLANGDMYSHTIEDRSRYYINYALAYGIAGNIYKDPYLKGEFERQLAMYSPALMQCFYITIFTDPTVETKLYKDYPLATYTKYPLSAITARTSRQYGYDSDCAMAFMNFHEVFLGDHQHTYTGDFQIYYKGPLAIDTGTYNASNEHNVAYNAMSYSANTVLVKDPAETFLPTFTNTKVPNYGQQRTPYAENPYVMKLGDLNLDSENRVQNESLTVSKNVRHYIGANDITPDFSYISGDLESAYTDKVTDYRRSMVLIDLDNDDYPAAFIVYDKIDASNAEFEKTWLLHSEAAPIVSGNKTVITRTDDGYNGKLVNETLIPAADNTDITVVGGSNNEMYNINGTLFQPEDNAREKGNYRIEVSPLKAQKQDKFLNAMYVMDADSNLADLPMIKEETDKFVGVTVMDKTVLFSSNGDLVDSAFSVTIRDNGYTDVTCLITDLAFGKWKIEGEGTNLILEAGVDSGCVTFTVCPGTYTVTPVSTGEVTEQSAEEKEKKDIGDFMVLLKNDGATYSYNGHFLYLEKPSVLKNNTAYLPAQFYKQLGAEVVVNENSATLTYNGVSYTYIADSKIFFENDKPESITYATFKENDTIYIAPTDLQKVFDITVGTSYLKNAKQITIRFN